MRSSPFSTDSVRQSTIARKGPRIIRWLMIKILQNVHERGERRMKRQLRTPPGNRESSLASSFTPSALPTALSLTTCTLGDSRNYPQAYTTRSPENPRCWHGGGPHTLSAATGPFSSRTQLSIAGGMGKRIYLWRSACLMEIDECQWIGSQ